MTDDADPSPHWSLRSSLAPIPGKYRMRNGHTAMVEIPHVIEYIGGQIDNPKDPRRKKKFRYWSGHCIDCGAKMSWNLNGTYAAIGTNGNDLMERLP